MDHSTPSPVPSVFAAARIAWTDMRAAVLALWPLACLSIGVSLLNDVTFGILGTGEFTTLLLALASAIALTPFLIAVHRFVILGEIVGDYRSIWFTPRFWTFVTLLTALTLAGLAPSLPLRWLPQESATGAGISAAALLAVLLASLWLSLIFPAMAVDAPGLSLTNAAKDPNGNVLRLFCVGLISVLPLVLLAVLLDLMAVCCLRRSSLCRSSSPRAFTCGPAIA